MLKKILFLTYCLVLPLVLLELFCIFFRPAPLFETINITSTSGLQYRLTDNPNLIYVPIENNKPFNNVGHRGPDYPLQAPEGKKRVAFVGDSVVEGFLLPIEQRFTEKLKAEHIEALNFGVRGYNLKQYIEYLKLRVLKFKPQAVIVGLTFNDLSLDSGEIAVLKETIEKLDHNGFYAAYYGVKSSFVRTLLNLNFFRYAYYYMSKKSQAHEEFSIRARENFKNEQRQSDSLFSELVELSKQHGFYLSFIVFPVNPDFNNHSQISTMLKSTEKLEKRVLNLEQIAKERYTLDERRTWFLNKHDPCHLNEAGMEIVAKLVEQNLGYLLDH